MENVLDQEHGQDKQPQATDANSNHGPTYFVNIEGIEHPWSGPTITTEQIAALGGWDVTQGVLEVDKDNNERTLSPGELIELKPGHGFAKKVRWKRGDSIFDDRLEQELALLNGRYPDARREGEWFLIPDWQVAVEGWNRASTPVAFRAQAGFPAAQPYGIFVPAGIRYRDAVPQNYQEPVNEKLPFPPDVWGMFSWSPEDAQWRPGTTARSGSNLLNFALSISQRFRQGA